MIHVDLSAERQTVETPWPTCFFANVLTLTIKFKLRVRLSESDIGEGIARSGHTKEKHSVDHQTLVCGL